MKWEHLDLTAGTWSKPPSSTKQNEAHIVPLSAPARQLLAERMGQKAGGEAYVFPGNGSKHHIVNVWHAWQRICKTAEISGLRLHDIRHRHPSALAGAGHIFPVIRALLGRRQAKKTPRYARLFAEP